MLEKERGRIAFTFAFVFMLIISLPAQAQRSTEAPVVYHKIDGRLRIRNIAASNMRVRLVREDQHRPIAETFSRSGGEFEFPYVPEGEYLVETFETKDLEATSTFVKLRPLPRERPSVLHVEVDIPEKSAERIKPGVITADVDVNVPKEAIKHYHAGMKALGENKAERGVSELQRAIEIYRDYYAARLELGGELRSQKRFDEAEEVLRPLREIAPRRIESWLEHGIILLELKRHEEAAQDLRSAVEREEANWTAHLYLGWALLEDQPESAVPHLKRAIELNEQKAARAHLALARIADSKGERQLAIEHLDAYLALQPDASDAAMARQLVERLRKMNQEEKKNSP
ncbi:MAG TPA: tetratricopeptide repeat protein [Pyrinomonadaceae bacterium]|jgi:tetratricopeptide (TPR) repeat protein|nr:tetratricopeptide repeat protein [Pyrinomonadaceae bacterium]